MVLSGRLTIAAALAVAVLSLCLPVFVTDPNPMLNDPYLDLELLFSGGLLALQIGSRLSLGQQGYEARVRGCVEVASYDNCVASALMASNSGSANSEHPK